MKDGINDIALEQNWELPIPRHHMVAICALLTISLLTAVFLPTPHKLQVSNQSAWTTGRLPDNLSANQNIIYVEDEFATENIDAEPVADSVLFDTEEVAQETANETEGEAKPLDWFIQTVQKGDSINNIFHTLNLSYDSLKALENTTPYGNTLNSIRPGDKLYFQLDGNNEIQVLIKPLNKTEQVRFVRTSQESNRFDAFKEQSGIHLENVIAKEDQVSANVKEAVDAAITSTLNATEKTSLAQAISTTQAASQEKLSKEEEMKLLLAEAEKYKEDLKPQISVRKSLVVVKINKGDTLISAAKTAGLTENEAYSMLRLLRGRVVAKHIHPGDELRILFAGNKPGSKINAVYLKSKKQGVITAFRNPADNKFYDDAGMLSTNNTKFRRYPIAGPIRITSNFNPYRRHPITGKIRPHKGTDFGVRIGTPVFAPADGVVTRATWQNAAGYYIVIKHKGAYSTVYMHLSKILVKVGQKVKMNQRIALSGNTGRSTGPHLHYEVRINNKAVNAMKISLPNNGSPVKVANKRQFATLIKKYKIALGIQ